MLQNIALIAIFLFLAWFGLNGLDREHIEMAGPILGIYVLVASGAVVAGLHNLWSA